GPVFPCNRLLLGARDTQAPCHRAWPAGTLSRQVTDCYKVGSGAGEPRADLEAPAGLARGFDLAAGGGDDVLHDGEAETGATARALLVASVEALEQAGQVERVDALA